MAYCPFYNMLGGSMEDESLVWLYQEARKASSVVEVGSYLGRSAHALLSGCDGLVHCVDTFKGSVGEESMIDYMRREDVQAFFLTNVGRFENLILHVGESVQVATEFAANSVDMVFLDASHDTASVIADIHAWSPKCRKLLCGHDITNEDVQAALKECNIHYQTYGSNIWYQRRDK